jgi:hypothetical protein
MKMWKLNDLFVDHTTGRLRESKVWSNIGKATMTWALVKLVLDNHLTEWYVFAYGGLVLGHEVYTRILNQKEQNGTKPST